MALATTCPACKTSFKVNPEQLKLRKGLVRCGRCDHVFSGVDFLRYVREKRNEPEADKKPATEKQSTADTSNDNAESDALSPDTETVAQDLNTAFFLPETQIDLDATSHPNSTESDTGTNTDDSAETPAGKVNTRKQPRSKSARRNSRRRKRRRAADRDPNATSPDIAAIEDRRQAGRRRADGAEPTPEETQPGSPEPATDSSNDTVTPAMANTESEKQDLFDRQFGQAIAAKQDESDDTPSDSTDDTEDYAEDFPDTLQANLPEAWQTTAIWPTYEESMLEGSRPADLPSDVGERDYRGKSKKTDTGSDSTSRDASAEDQSADDDAQRTDHDDDLRSESLIEQSDDINEESADEIAVAQTAHEQPDALGKDEAPQKSEEDAIDFFGQTSKPVFDFDLPPRSVWLAAAGLTVLLALQGAIGARDTLAAMFPPVKPVLQSLVSPLGLTVELPLNPEAITIESFDLINTADSGYVMNMLMRNRANTPLRWPAIELTLTDSTGGILVRKALMPADYLKDAQVVASGITENSEHIVRLQFNAQGISPSGYSAVLFYY